MKLYEVIENTRILHNGKAYAKGDQLKLSDDEAVNLGVFVKEVVVDDEQKPEPEPKPATSTRARTAKAST